MANQDDAPKPSRPRRAVPARQGHTPPAWEETIENQRARLMQVQGLLHCLHEVLMYAEDEHAVTYADLAQLANVLIGDCVAGLDLMKLRRQIKQRSEASAGGLPPGGLEVREPPPARYLC